MPKRTYSNSTLPNTTTPAPPRLLDSTQQAPAGTFRPIPSTKSLSYDLSQCTGSLAELARRAPDAKAEEEAETNSNDDEQLLVDAIRSTVLAPTAQPSEPTLPALSAPTSRMFTAVAQPIELPSTPEAQFKHILNEFLKLTAIYLTDEHVADLLFNTAILLKNYSDDSRLLSNLGCASLFALERGIAILPKNHKAIASLTEWHKVILTRSNLVDDPNAKERRIITIRQHTEDARLSYGRYLESALTRTSDQFCKASLGTPDQHQYQYLLRGLAPLPSIQSLYSLLPPEKQSAILDLYNRTVEALAQRQTRTPGR